MPIMNTGNTNGDTSSLTTDAPLWVNKNAKQSRMYEYLQFVKEKYPQSDLKTDDYEDLYKWSISDLNAFWSSIVDFCDLQFDGKFVPLKDPNATVDSVPAWFDGATLNFTECLLNNNNNNKKKNILDNNPAVYSISEQSDQVGSCTFGELKREIIKMALALEHMGIKPGDRVCAYAPNVRQVVVFALAAAAVGAVYAAASADFGPDAVIDRFLQIEPRVMLVGNGAFYNGRRHEQMAKVQTVLEKLPSVEKCIVVPVLDSVDVPADPKFVEYDQFIGTCETQQYDKFTFTKFPFGHPLYIMFSSGTTGKPKCIVHSAGGTLIQHVKEHTLHMDLRAGDVFLQFTLTGWMMWQWMITGLALGAAIVLHDGSPLKPDPIFLWSKIADLRVTHLGISPKYLHALKDFLRQREGERKPGRLEDKMDLQHLRVITSTGSVLPPELFTFVYNSIKADVMLASITGGTDIISLFAGGCPLKPVYAGELQCICLGMAAEAWVKEDGDQRVRRVLNQPGDLVCTRPFPSQPVYFYGDDSRRSLYRKAYFDWHPGVWHHGDFVIISSLSGGVTMLGRSDGTLNPMGIRFGSSELYNLFVDWREIEDTLAISYKRVQDTDEKLVLFVKMADGFEMTEEFVVKMKGHIRGHLSARHVPSFILACPDIPYTTNGKKVEVAVKRILSHLVDFNSLSHNHGSLANPECMSFFFDLAQQPTLYE